MQYGTQTIAVVLGWSISYCWLLFLKWEKYGNMDVIYLHAIQFAVRHSSNFKNIPSIDKLLIGGGQKVLLWES